VSRIKLRYVHAFVDKRYGRAKPRYYFRRRGFKQTPLPGMPGSPEFNEAYAFALSGQTAIALPVIRAKHVRSGSIGALALAYFSSPGFLALKPSTQQTYRLIIEKFTSEHGDKPLAQLTRAHVNAMLAARVGKPAAANHWLRLLKTMMRFAVVEELRKDDPTVAIDFIKRKSPGFHTWTEDEISQFEAHHPIGSRPRLALALLLYTAQRRSDVVRMGHQHLVRGVAHVRQIKTDATIAIPLHPVLAEILAATPTVGVKTFLVTSAGQAYTAAGFGNAFRTWCDEAGLPKHCAAHGLRKAACRRLAEAGCSANVIASISGHTSLREVELYTKAADQVRMARQGMAAISSKGAHELVARPRMDGVQGRDEGARLGPAS
jgi:integrase